MMVFVCELSEYLTLDKFTSAINEVKQWVCEYLAVSGRRQSLQPLSHAGKTLFEGRYNMRL